MPVLRAPFAHRHGGGRIGVFDQFTRGPCVAETRVHGDVGINPEQTAESQELVCSDIVGLQCVPHGIEDRRPLVNVAYTVAPLVCGDEVAAGKTQNAKTQPFERGDYLGTEALDVIRGH